MHRTLAITPDPRVDRLGTYSAPAHSSQLAEALRQAATVLVAERNGLLAAGRHHASVGLAARDGDLR
jgi:hypothetical protein